MEMGDLPRPSSHVRNLGVIIDDSLTMQQQAVRVSSTCFTIMKWLRKILWMLPADTQKTVVHALITSRLDYGNVLYLGSNKAVTRRLQLVQNSAARLLCRVPKTTSISKYLHDLHWLRIENRIKFKALSYMFKIRAGTAPQYLKNLVRSYTPTRHLRSETHAKFTIPRIKLSRMGGRSFAYLGPTLWNSLPLDLRKETSFVLFRKSLKTWLFNK